MDLSYNWIKKHVDLEGITPEQLADEITLAGLEVEGMKYLASANNLVIGKVINVSEHPDSDKLKVAQVDVGNEVLQIVCGAPNVAENQKVIVATEGAELPEITIKPVKLRGVASNGMICSLNELGVDKEMLSEAQMAGIEVLEDEAEVGNTEVLEYLGLDDVIIDVDLTPNRSDCLSLFALAKEVGAILNRKVSLPEIEDYSGGSQATLKVGSTTENSQRIAGKYIHNVEIKESPTWIKQTLTAHGMTPRNNVVDISNLVMLETGQPLHFYDADALETKELIVQDHIETEYTALDGQKYEIKTDDLMITSNGQNIGIAGIMGGDSTKIKDSTQSIIIESANFNLVNIRTTARRLNINTDASLRFSRELNPNAMDMAMNRATQLLVEYANATDYEETVYYGEKTIEPKKIVTSPNYLNKRLGTDFSIDEIVEVFDRLSFEPVIIDNTIHTTIPTYRQDIVSEVDLSEELIRIIGYDVIESTMPKVTMTAGGMNKKMSKRSQLKTLIRGAGFSEIISYSLVSKKHLNNSVLSIGDPVEISNPLSKERQYYRTSLLPSMLDVISYNEARRNHEYMLFEIANVYNDAGQEEERLSLAMSSYLELSRWQDLKTIGNFYHIKGGLDLILSKLGINENRVEYVTNTDDHTIFHPNQSAQIMIDRKLVGVIGKIHPKLKEEYDINDTVLAEIKLDVIYDLKPARIRYHEIPKYPSVSQDIAAIVDEDLHADQLIDTIKRVGKDIIEDAEVFDVYQGENVDEGKKSLAIRVIYQALDHTLTDQEVAAVHEKIVEELKAKHDIIYRDK